MPAHLNVKGRWARAHTRHTAGRSCISVIPECHTFALLSNKRKQHPFTAKLPVDRLDSLVVAFFHCVCDTKSFAHPCIFLGFDAAAAAAATHPLLCPKQNEKADDGK